MELPDESMMTARVWRLQQVMTQTGLSRSTIYEMIKREEFPRQFKLGARAVGWLAEDVLDWIDSRFCEPDSGDRDAI